MPLAVLYFKRWCPSVRPCVRARSCVRGRACPCEMSIYPISRMSCCNLLITRSGGEKKKAAFDSHLAALISPLPPTPPRKSPQR